MDTLMGRRGISMKALTDFSNLDARTRHHLKNVYSALALTMMAAGVGAVAYFYMGPVMTVLSLIASVLLIIGLAMTPHSPANTNKRLGMLCGFGFCSGFGLGPLLSYVIEVDPSIIPTAFVSTSAIFVCFSLTALYSERRTWLYLGGMLFSGLTILLLAAFVNIFIRSDMVFQLQLYLGLVIFCGFILFDTQLIVEKVKSGNDDYIWHSVDLFLDFINIFRRLLVILASKEKKRKN